MEAVLAGKAKLGRDEALALAKAADKIVAARGRSVIEFEMKTAPPDEATLLSAILGPTGNLRAPTLRVGRTLLIGFNEDAYERLISPGKK